MAASLAPRQASTTPSYPSPIHDIYDFSFLPHLLTTHRFGIPPSRPNCPAYRAGHCPLGSSCPDKHPLTHSTNNLVCKHWLKGLCKKGDACDFLHEWNLRARSDCRQWVGTSGYCAQGEDCNYLHPDLDGVEERRRPVCAWYERGFCPLGSERCRFRHVKGQALCGLYLAGFCPDGRGCRRGRHARWREEGEMPPLEVRVERSKEEVEMERERTRMEAEERDVRDWERGEGGRGRGRGKRGFRGGRRGGY